MKGEFFSQFICLIIKKSVIHNSDFYTEFWNALEKQFHLENKVLMTKIFTNIWLKSIDVFVPL